jgi:glycosyltransferase involved in cell wall biosynthesis
MAGGVPCLVTDGVDSAEIVGTTGLVVPPADPLALGEARGKLTGGRLEDLTRQRIEERHSSEAGVSMHEDHHLLLRSR